MAWFVRAAACAYSEDMRGWIVCVCATAMAVVGRVSAGVPQGATFRTSANSVAIYATVLDRDHHLVTNLTQDEFDVRDNGKKVALSVFSAEPTPITLGIMLDMSGSMEPNMPLVVDATETLIDKLRPDDRARLGAFGNRTLMSPSFTSDHDDLLRFLHTRIHAGGETPLWNSVDIMLVYLDQEPGRRVVLVFTDGFDTTTFKHGYEAVQARADREDVMIYAIGCWRGPGTGDERPDSNLRKLAEHMGGGYSELTWAQSQDLGPTFARIADELHHQYVLGFVPALLDGKVHELDVRVKRSGLTVRARKTYTATPSGGVPEPGAFRPRGLK